jgi:hypothetical protein
MGRIFGILFIGLGIWVGLKIYLEGTQNAFGGVFASHRIEREEPRTVRTTPQRAGDAVKSSQALEAERRERLMTD